MPMPNEWSSPYEWANAYRAEELCVVPAKPDEKRPALAEWREYQINGIPSDTHNRWYAPRGGEHRLNSRMGFITGPANLDADSAMFVIDLDEKDGVSGRAAWQRKLDEHEGGIDFDTWRATTGTGGQHLYFRCPVDRCPRTQKHITLGIDVRGVGGFIMAPPSTRKEGTGSYDWVPRFSPWECDIAEAPEWLLAYLESLCGTGTAADMTEVVRHKSSLGLDTGKVEDGREGYATRMVFKAFARLTATLKRPPTLAELFDDVWPVWDKKVNTTAQGKERGPEFIREKCAYTIGRFTRGEIADLKTVADAEAIVASGEASAAEDEFGSDAFGGAAQAAPGIRIQTTAEFVGEWSPKPFLLKPVIETGRLYTATGPTGTGKTAIALLIALHIARGVELAGRKVRRAPVLFLAGENHEDVRTRWLTMLKIEGIDPDTVDVHFVGGRFSIEGHFATVKEHMEKHATGLVIVDTLQAFFDGDDSNSNEQMKALAHVLRRIANLGPAVVVPAHPVKNVSKDRNVPYGGGALLNEVDGNLSLWGEPETVQLSWCGKFRGSFEPIDFALDVVEMPGAVDTDGDPIKTVKARVIGAIEVEQKAAAIDQMLKRLLFVVYDNKGASERSIIDAYNARFPEAPAKRSTVQRRLGELKSEKLIERTLGRWRLTGKGAEIIGVRDT